VRNQWLFAPYRECHKNSSFLFPILLSFTKLWKSLGVRWNLSWRKKRIRVNKSNNIISGWHRKLRIFLYIWNIWKKANLFGGAEETQWLITLAKGTKESVKNNSSRHVLKLLCSEQEGLVPERKYRNCTYIFRVCVIVT